MKKQTTKKIRVIPSNSRKQLKKDLGFSVNKASKKASKVDMVFTDNYWDINTCEEYFEKQ